MPALVKLLTPTGLLNADYSAESLKDAARYEPDGIYTVTNTYNTYQTLKLQAHFDRMEDSARRQQIPLQLDRARIRAALRQMITEANYGDVRFRITVPASNPDTFILTIEPFHAPAAILLEQGVRCITAANSARHDAESKTTGWMHDREALTNAMPAGIYDTFLLDEHGYMLEGLAANFYAVVDGVLLTAGQHVLKGIARQIVLEIAPPIVPVREEAPHVSAIARFRDAFLTSASRGIIPVVEIDGIRIGDGVPGALTRRLIAAYQTWVSAHLEEL